MRFSPSTGADITFRSARGSHHRHHGRSSSGAKFSYLAPTDATLSRIDALKAWMEIRFERIESKVDNHIQKMDRIRGGINRHLGTDREPKVILSFPRSFSWI